MKVDVQKLQWTFYESKAAAAVVGAPNRNIEFNFKIICLRDHLVEQYQFLQIYGALSAPKVFGLEGSCEKRRGHRRPPPSRHSSSLS